MKVTVTSASVVQLRQGPDHVYLETDLPDPVWPFRGTLTLKFECARGTSAQFLEEHFKGLPVTVTP